MKNELAEAKNFHFGSIEQMPLADDVLIGVVEAGISDSARLLRRIADALDFPSYFGNNWNVLYDCLRDFHWTKKKHVYLFHRDIPQLSTQELRIYFEILRDASADWKPEEAHLLSVVFEECDRDVVLGALNLKK